MFELHAISPGNQATEILIEKLVQIYDTVDYIHLREGQWTASQFQLVIDSIKEYDLSLSKLIINDRVDLAHTNDMGRVHLPSHGLRPKQMQTYFPQVKFGCSVHDLETAKVKEAEGASYLIFGHVYATNSKKHLEARGLESLAQIVKAVSIPVIAIGGISPERVSEVYQTGVKGVAVMSGIFSSEDSNISAQRYRFQINQLLGE